MSGNVAEVATEGTGKHLPAGAEPKAITLQPVIVRVPSSSYQLPWWGVWLVALLPLMLTAVGWFVVGRQNDRRERRKDMRDAITDIKKRLELIELHCVEYVQCPPKNLKSSVLAAQIKGDIQAVGSMLKNLESGGLSFTRWDLQTALRQEATGGDFESSSRLVGDANRPAMVGLAVQDIIADLDVLYFNAFPISI